MSRATVQFNDYVSLAVMLLMLVALLGGQSGSVAHADEPTEPTVLAEADNNHVLTIDFDGQFGDSEVTIKLVADKDLNYFRGEDE